MISIANTFALNFPQSGQGSGVKGTARVDSIQSLRNVRIIDGGSPGSFSEKTGKTIGPQLSPGRLISVVFPNPVARAGTPASHSVARIGKLTLFER